MQENGTDTNPNVLKRFITGEVGERPNNSSETDNPDTLIAIENIDPDTGETYWYTKNPDTGERTILSVKKDEKDVLRELLPDGSPGREIVQDPHDDPMRYIRLAGGAPLHEATSNSAQDSPQSFIAETLTTGNLSAGETITTDNASEPTPSSPFAAAASNTLASASSDLAAEAKQAKNLAHQTQSPQTYAELAEETKTSDLNPLEILRHKRTEALKSLDTAAEALQAQADALATLNIPNAPNLYRIRAATLIAKTRAELTAAPDQKSLNIVQSTYFASQDIGKLQTQKQQLLDKPNASTFEAALTEVKTIPEASAIVSYLIQGRSEALEKIKAKGEAASAQTSSPDLTPPPESTNISPEEQVLSQAAVELDGQAPKSQPAPPSPLAPLDPQQSAPYLHALPPRPNSPKPNPNSPEDYLYQNLAA